MSRSPAVRIVLLAALLLLAAALPAAASLGEAAAVVAGLDALQGKVELWPGFDPWSIPVAVFDGERTYLFRHPSPSEGFQPVSGHDGVFVLDGRHEAVSANSSAKIGGVRTATLMLESLAGSPLPRQVEVLVHEGFHVFQRERHPKWSANEAVLFVYPVDDAEGLGLRRLESVALGRALDAEGKEPAACWTRTALAAREKRFAALGEEFAAYERYTELNEGLATYVGQRAAGDMGLELLDEVFPATSVRQRAYDTGAGLGHLLDRFSDGWHHVLEGGDERPLDDLLKASLPSGEACELPAAEWEAIRAAALRDAAAVGDERVEKEHAFLAREGWRVVITASDPSNPLFPERFDPINVLSLGGGKVLHERFVRLGNAAGSAEVLGRASLSTGPGPHPIFNGVRSLLVAGIDEEPSVEERDGVVSVEADGLVARLRGSVERRGRTVEVRLAADETPH